MLINRNLRKLVHVFRQVNPGQGTYFSEEFQGAIRNLSRFNWDAGLLSVHMNAWAEKDRFGANGRLRLGKLMDDAIKAQPQAMPTDKEKLQTFMKYIESVNDPSLDPSLTRKAYNLLQWNNFSVPGFKEL